MRRRNPKVRQSACCHHPLHSHTCPALNVIRQMTDGEATEDTLGILVFETFNGPILSPSDNIGKG